jgi:HD-GYP domain-containing protein (c-di-GMP phosphodiesterase class II)
MTSPLRATSLPLERFLESVLAEEQTQEQYERLAALHAIDAAFSGKLELSAALDIFLGQVIEQLDVDSAAVLLYDSAASSLMFARGVGCLAQSGDRPAAPIGYGPAGCAAETLQPEYVQDLTQSPFRFLFDPGIMKETQIAYYAMPLQARGEIKGVLELYSVRPLSLDTDWFAFLNILAEQGALGIDSAMLFRDLQDANQQLIDSYDATIQGLSQALVLRDKETEGHCRRVTELTLQLARAMGIEESELVHIRRGAVLHDIGKIGVPDSILHKPGPLNDAEWDIMRRHPQLAYELLAPIAFLRPALAIPCSHHEHWDGTGYPQGLKGEEIPLAARLFALADVWDALCSDRPYGAAWSIEKVREHIGSLAGAHFDPRVVEVFLGMDCTQEP